MGHSIFKEVRFESSHYLENYEGKCNNIHGHNYVVEIEIEAEELYNGFVVDFTEIKELIKDKYDHKMLNNVDENLVSMPTAEKLAETIYHDVNYFLAEQPNTPHCFSVSVWENESSCASFSDNMIL